MIIGIIFAIIVVSIVAANVLMKTNNKTNAYTIGGIWLVVVGGLVWGLFAFINSL